MLDWILDEVAKLDGGVLHLAAFALAFGETALFTDVFVPGEVGMVVVGAAAARRDMAPWGLMGAAALGATLGDCVGYLLGRRWGAGLVRRWAPLRRHLEPPLQRAEGFFADHGGSAVFLGRFVGAARGVVPFVAGAAGLPFGRFLRWNVAASVVWCGGAIGAGYLLGRQAGPVVDRIGLGITLAAAVAVATWWAVRRVRRVRRGDGSGGPRDGAEGRDDGADGH